MTNQKTSKVSNRAIALLVILSILVMVLVIWRVSPYISFSVNIR